MQISSIDRWTIAAGAAFALLAVAIGAFAAHGLKAMLDARALALVETAVRYQMYHALALLLLGALATARRFSARWLTAAAAAFSLGIVAFSGSLYLLALGGAGWWGAIVPVGGVAFILGWAALIAAALVK